jgi:hypothetical protein
LVSRWLVVRWSSTIPLGNSPVTLQHRRQLEEKNHKDSNHSRSLPDDPRQYFSNQRRTNIEFKWRCDHWLTRCIQHYRHTQFIQNSLNANGQKYLLGMIDLVLDGVHLPGRLPIPKALAGMSVWTLVAWRHGGSILWYQRPGQRRALVIMLSLLIPRWIGKQAKKIKQYSDDNLAEKPVEHNTNHKLMILLVSHKLDLNNKARSAIPQTKDGQI